MRVAVFERFGGPEVLEFVDLPSPDPDDDEILIKVHATTVTAAECQMRRGRPLWGRLILGVLRPRGRRRRKGRERAGDVVSVGKEVSVCGEMAARPDLAAFLVAIGVDSLSVTPRAIPELKQALAAVHLKPLTAAAGRILACRDSSETELALRACLAARGGPCDN